MISTHSSKAVAAVTPATSAVPILPAVAVPSAAVAPERLGMSVAATASSEHEEQLRPHLELITADRRGRFYTPQREGAEIAERKHGFIPTDESKGITMLKPEVPGRSRCTVCGCARATRPTCW